MDDSRSGRPRSLTGEQTIGELTTLGEPCEPFGELSFFKMIDVFYDKAYALDEEGAEAFLLEGMDTMAEIRAAVLACRRLEKPIMVMLDVKDEDIDTMGGRELAYLISLQDIGVSAFGLRSEDGECLKELLKQLYPYSRIPLFVRPEAGKVIANEIRQFIACGVEMFDCRGISPAEQQVVKVETDRANFESMRSRKEDISFIAANEEQAFFLNPERISFSPQIDIECDMASELVDFEDESFDVISILIETFDDGFRFSQNMHYLSRPIMFSTTNAEALRMALQYYNGRALVDAKCGIEENELKEIADEFGAIVY